MGIVSSSLSWKQAHLSGEVMQDNVSLSRAPRVLRDEDLRKIGAMGFHRWYDKQMLEARLALVLAFICLIVLMVGFEMLLAQPVAMNIALKLLIVGLGCVVAYLAFFKFRNAILLAESIGKIATCIQCKYPSFSVVKRETDRVSKDFGARLSHDLTNEGLLVRCRRCNHKWRWGVGV